MPDLNLLTYLIAKAKAAGADAAAAAPKVPTVPVVCQYS